MATIEIVNNILRDFLVHMDNDTRGVIGGKKEYFNVPIKLFLEKNEVALNFYSEFIKTSTNRFPTLEMLINTIDEANMKFFVFEKKSHFFCLDLWLCIHH